MGMICPRDSSPLETQSMGDISLKYCGRCFGMWFKRDDLRDMFLGSKEQKYLMKLREPVVLHNPDLDHTCCPEDHHSIMSGFDFEGIKLDVCRKHRGIWLDHGELLTLYSVYLKQTDGESFLKEDTRRFMLSLFRRRFPALTLSCGSKMGISAFLVALNTIFAPLDLIGWITNSPMISKLFEDEENDENAGNGSAE